MATTRCTTITPIVPVTNMGRAIAFYHGVLGFEVGVQEESYAYLVRDDIALRLVGTDGDDAPPQQSCYICVDGLEALYEDLKPALDRLPEGRVRPPFVQDYGQREFHVIDEDSLLLFFGEPA